MTLNLRNKLLKMLIMFVVYLTYTTVATALLGDSMLVIFLADILFLVGIIYIYKDNLINDFRKLKEKNLWKQVGKAFMFAIAVFIVYMLVGAVLTTIYPEIMAEDGNTDAIYSIYSMTTIYTIFKTLVFATVAEELLFKESIRDLIKPNLLYVLVSSFIYAFMNIMYSNLTIMTTWLNSIPYLLFALLLNTIYVKQDDNICLVIMIKFFYNLVPLTIMLSGLGA